MPRGKGGTEGKTKKGKRSYSKEEIPVEGDVGETQRVEVDSQPVAQDAKDDFPARSSTSSNPVSDIASAATESTEEITDTQAVSEVSNITMEERANKLNALRLRMRQSAQANRADLIAESHQLKISTRDAARIEKQRRLHDILRLKADAEEREEDAERVKNWEYTIAENDEWEKRLKRKKRRADFEFHDDSHAARRKYKKDLDYLKPDLAAYNAQKEKAMGYAPGTLIRGSSVSELNNLQVATVSHEQQIAAENLYRDANSLLYADNKPSEETIDKVVSKLNLDLDKRGKRSRKRLHEDDGDITYINERNRVFNKKIARYYDKYTSEIRASFERGTAL